MNVAIWGGVGALAGWISLWTQAWTVARLEPGAPWRALLLVIGGAYCRWAMIAGVFLLALRQGIVETLAACVGLMVVRGWLVVQIHRGKAFRALLR